MAFSLLGLRQVKEETLPPTSAANAFRLGHALMFALVIAAVLLVSEGLRQLFGQAGALAGATIAALGELHAAAASIASLAASGGLELATARWGVIALLASASLAKSILAFASGGPRYGAAVSAGLAAMVAGAAASAWLVPG